MAFAVPEADADDAPDVEVNADAVAGTAPDCDPVGLAGLEGARTAGTTGAAMVVGRGGGTPSGLAAAGAGAAFAVATVSDDASMQKLILQCENSHSSNIFVKTLKDDFNQSCRCLVVVVV